MKNQLKTSLFSVIKRGHYLYYFINWLITVFEDYKIAKMRMDKTIFGEYKDSYPSQSISYCYLKLFVEKVKFDKDDVFVDVGSAWGRMIGYLNQHTRISKFIGVELNNEIANLSKKIFLKYDNVKIISGDIVENIPKNATVFYLFNPFNEVIMEKFLDAIEHNIEHPVRILYLYPTCKSVFDRRSTKWTLTNRYILKPKHMGELELIEYRYIP